MRPFADKGLELAFQKRYDVRFWQNFRGVALTVLAFCLLLPVFQRIAWPTVPLVSFLALIMIPFIGFFIFLSQFEPYLRLINGRTQTVASTLFTIFILGVEAATAFNLDDYYGRGRIHIILCYVLFIHVGLRLQFRWASASAAVVSMGCIGYQFALSNVNVRLIVILVLTNAVGGGLSWALEAYFRRDFLAKAEAERVARKLRDVSAAVMPAAASTKLQRVADLAVLFSDLVGFTKFSQTVTPARLIATLNQINQRFDAEADRLGISKIKTLGDAAVYVSGLSGAPNPEALRQLSERMLACLDETNRELGCNLQIRIGLGRGPAITGVVGKMRRRFDLWGEAIESAEEAQKAASPGEIREAPRYGTAAKSVTTPTSYASRTSA